jgi:hypothetical protein
MPLLHSFDDPKHHRCYVRTCRMDAFSKSTRAANLQARKCSAQYTQKRTAHVVKLPTMVPSGPKNGTVLSKHLRRPWFVVYVKLGLPIGGPQPKGMQSFEGSILREVSAWRVPYHQTTLEIQDLLVQSMKRHNNAWGYCIVQNHNCHTNWALTCTGSENQIFTKCLPDRESADLLNELL